MVISFAQLAINHHLVARRLSDNDILQGQDVRYPAALRKIFAELQRSQNSAAASLGRIVIGYDQNLLQDFTLMKAIAGTVAGGRVGCGTGMSGLGMGTGLFRMYIGAAGLLRQFLFQ